MPLPRLPRMAALPPALCGGGPVGGRAASRRTREGPPGSAGRQAPLSRALRTSRLQREGLQTEPWVTRCPVPQFLHLGHGRRMTPPRGAVRLSRCRGGHGAASRPRSFPLRLLGQQPWSRVARCLPCPAHRGRQWAWPLPIAAATGHAGPVRLCSPAEGSLCEPPVAARGLRGHCTRAPAGGGRAPRAGRRRARRLRPSSLVLVDRGGLGASSHRGRGAARPSAGTERQMSPSRHHEQGREARPPPPLPVEPALYAFTPDPTELGLGTVCTGHRGHPGCSRTQEGRPRPGASGLLRATCLQLPRALNWALPQHGAPLRLRLVGTFANVAS